MASAVSDLRASRRVMTMIIDQWAGQPLEVSDGAPGGVIQGSVRSTTPAAGQHFEGIQVTEPINDLTVNLSAVLA